MTDWLTDDVVKEIAEYGGLVIAASTLVYNLYTRNFSPIALLGGIVLGVVWWLLVPLLKCAFLDGHSFLYCAGASAVDAVKGTVDAAATAGAEAITGAEGKVFGWDKLPPPVKKAATDYADCANKSSILTGFMGPAADPACLGVAVNAVNSFPPPPKVDPIAYKIPAQKDAPKQVNPNATLRYDPVTKQWSVIDIKVDVNNVYQSSRTLFEQLKKQGTLDSSIFQWILSACSPTLSEVERQACVRGQNQIQQAAYDVLNNTNNPPGDVNQSFEKQKQKLAGQLGGLGI